MRNFSSWLEHRMHVRGLFRRCDLAHAAGMTPETLQQIFEDRNLDGVDRSLAYWLAKALWVSVGRLRKLADGVIEWIEDTDICPPDRPRNFVRPGPEREQVKIVKKNGYPILGWCSQTSGRVELDECWTEMYGGRVPLFDRAYPRSYAFHTGSEGDGIIFKDVPAYEAKRGDLVAMYVGDGGEGQGFTGRLANMGMTMEILPECGGTSVMFLAENVMRTGKLLKRYTGREVQRIMRRRKRVGVYMVADDYAQEHPDYG